jgi:hypothetical protein
METDVSKEKFASIFIIENQSRKKPVSSRWLGLPAWSKLVFARMIFDLQDGDDTFLRNLDPIQTTWSYIPEDGNIHFAIRL